MDYNWSAFNLRKALDGQLVGLAITGQSWNLSRTGHLHRENKLNILEIPGYRLSVSDSGPNAGKVTGQIPERAEGADDYFVGQTVYIVDAVMGADGSVGTEVTRSSGSSGQGYGSVAVLSTIEPRDQFAIQVLNAMLTNMEHPELYDDAKCLAFARSAYRWAQAMMIAAADSRNGKSESTTPSTAVEVKSEDLQNNTEKLLYNISQSLATGIVVKGTTESGAAPIATKITEMPDVTIEEMPDVTFDGTPEVSVTNTPTVTLSGTSTVNVGNTPAVTLNGTPTVKVTTDAGTSLNVGFRNPPTVDVRSLPYVTLNGTPTVKVTNPSSTPLDVRVTNMPQEPIEIEGTVSVSTPSSSE